MPTPEFELVRNSAPYPLRLAESQRLSPLGRQVRNWNAVLALVKRHAVHPTVYLNLERYGGEAVPAQIIQELKTKYERSKLRSLALVAELLRLKEACDSRSIPIVPLKGPVLSKELFGDIGLRASGDLDLLVPYDSFAAADQVAHTLGYQLKEPVRPLTPRQWQAYTVLNHHNSYYHPDRRIVLEIHWSLANVYMMPLTATRDVLSRTRTINQFGANLSALSLEDTFSYLVLHGAKHHWARFKWILDIDAFTRSNISIDWEKAAASVVALGLQRPMAQGLLLAQRAFGTPIPEAAQQIVEAESTGATLADQAWQALTTDDDYLRSSGAFTQWKQANYIARLKPNSAARWSYLATFLLHSLNDWNDFPLPDSLFLLYYLMRPFTWFWRYFIRR